MNIHSKPTTADLRSSKPARFVPRRERSRRQFDRAFAEARASGVKAIDSFKVGFAAQGGTFALANDLKLDAERLIRSGAGYPETRYRFGDLARSLPADIDGAIRQIKLDIATAGTRIQLLVEEGFGGSDSAVTASVRMARLKQALMVLRWLRAASLGDHWPFILKAVSEPLPLIEAFRDFRNTVSHRRSV